MNNQNLETKFEDAHCPYFFDNRCKEEIYEFRFQTYCLNDFKNCETYQEIEVKNENTNI
jgi:hypothetical protein